MLYIILNFNKHYYLALFHILDIFSNTDDYRYIIHSILNCNLDRIIEDLTYFDNPQISLKAIRICNFYDNKYRDDEYYN